MIRAAAPRYIAAVLFFTFSKITLIFIIIDPESERPFGDQQALVFVIDFAVAVEVREQADFDYMECYFVKNREDAKNCALCKIPEIIVYYYFLYLQKREYFPQLRVPLFHQDQNKPL